jgi:hypothetical protein
VVGTVQNAALHGVKIGPKDAQNGVVHEQRINPGIAAAGFGDNFTLVDRVHAGGLSAV